MSDLGSPAPIRPADLDHVLALNECWAPHVGALDRGRLEAILDHAEVALAAEQGFVEVGRQWTCGDTVEVQLMVRPL